VFVTATAKELHVTTTRALPRAVIGVYTWFESRAGYLGRSLPSLCKRRR
jgi:hypothetical protein